MSILTSKRSTLRSAGLYLFATLVALGPLNSKILAAAWLFFWVFGFWNAFKARSTPSSANADTLPAASAWLIACIISFILASIWALIWHEPIDTLNAQFRLLLPAAGAFFLARLGRPLSTDVRTTLLHAIALACAVAFAWTIILTTQGSSVRTSLATNAIPWAVVISFYTCLLLPAALTEKNSRLYRLIWLFGVTCGLGAVLLSQSRGAFLIIPWCALVYAWFWYRRCAQGGSLRRTLVRLVSAIALVLICSWFGPGDILRMHQAAQDIKQVQLSENYNTSTGARLYLWEMAWDGIQQSPWIGIGSAERIRRIKHAGEGGTEEQLNKLQGVRVLSHVHNQYLHSALDGGLIGLGAFLSLLIGLLIAVLRLRSVDPIAAWQLSGVLFMHVTSNLTNVNFLHNYYVVALSLAAVLPLLGTRRNSADTEIS